MNANVVNSIISESIIGVEAALIDTKSKRVSKPKLIAKHERYLVFGYWFTDLLRNQESIDDVVFAAMLDKLRMYESIENQIALFDLFDSELGNTQKIVRKSIADYHRPPRATKKSTRVASIDSCCDDDAKPKPTKGRKKKATTVVVDNHDDFINQLVAVANATTTTTVASITTTTEKEVTQTLQIIETNPLNSIGNSKTVTEPQPKTKKLASIQKVNELLKSIPIDETKKHTKTNKQKHNNKLKLQEANAQTNKQKT